MSICAKSSWWSACVLASAMLAGCGGGGGAKAKPMVADSPPPSDDTAMMNTFSDGKGDADAGAAPATASGSGTSASTGDATASPPVLQGNEEGARALLSQFVVASADHLALTKSLRPTSSDYKSMFDTQTAVKVEAAQAKQWDSNKAVIKPKASQTEIKIWGATGADLNKGVGNAKEFPGGYKKVAKHLSQTVTFYRFKFVEAGKDTGTAYDGLAFVNGHWVIVPKPWLAIEGKSGGMDGDGDAAEKPEKPEKPAGKPKGKPKGKKH